MSSLSLPWRFSLEYKVFDENCRNVMMKKMINMRIMINVLLSACDHLHSVAIPYYLLNLRASIKLGHPVYYSKDAWVAFIKLVTSTRVKEPSVKFPF